jgi:hypothetical protein
MELFSAGFEARDFSILSRGPHVVLARLDIFRHVCQTVPIV